MTTIIAQRRGSEILLLGDTKIDNPGEPGPDIMPGQLKLVALGNRISVGFAGLAGPAGVDIRKAQRLAADRDLAGIVELLKQSSAGGGTDYLVASHAPEASLLRIRNGVALDVPDICAIGHDEPFRDLIDKARTGADEPLFKSDLRFRFIDRMLTNKNLGPYIGGFPIVLGATAHNHRYLACTGVYTYKFPNLKWGEETHQSIEEVYSGEGHFQMSVLPPGVSDVPVVGICLLQARMGYVYSPIERDHAFRVPLADALEPWEGKEQDMYAVLRRAVANHVANFDARSVDGNAGRLPVS